MNNLLSKMFDFLITRSVKHRQQPIVHVNYDRVIYRVEEFSESGCRYVESRTLDTFVGCDLHSRDVMSFAQKVFPANVKLPQMLFRFSGDMSYFHMPASLIIELSYGDSKIQHVISDTELTHGSDNVDEYVAGLLSRKMAALIDRMT